MGYKTQNGITVFHEDIVKQYTDKDGIKWIIMHQGDWPWPEKPFTKIIAVNGKTGTDRKFLEYKINEYPMDSKRIDQWQWVMRYKLKEMGWNISNGYLQR